MIARRRPMMLAMALVALCAAAVPASAQITTGSVAGTVKDPQGGVIPGAPVTLISETRGTQLSAVFTNANGDFSFVNVPPDRYTLPGQHDRLQDGQTDRRQRQRRRPRARRRGHRRSRRPDRDRPGHERGGPRPHAERRALVHGHDRLGREPAHRQPQLRRARLAGARRRPATTRIGGGGGEQHHDGRHLDDGHRQQRHPAADERGVDCRSEGPRRRATRPNTAGRAGCRSPPSPRAARTGSADRLLRVFRNSDWNSNSRTNILNGDPKTVLQEKDLGYSIGGPVGKPGGSNKLFFFYSHEYAPRTGGNNVVRYRLPTALERAGRLLADVSTTTARCIPYIKDPLPHRRMLGDEPGGLLPGRRRARPDPGQPALPDRPEHPQDVSAAERQRAGRRLQLRDHQADREAHREAAGDPRRLPADERRCAPRSSTRAGASRTRSSTARSPASTTRKQYKPVVSTLAVTVNYTLNPTTFLEATYGHSQNELTGCGLAQGGTGPTFCQTGSR